VFWKVLWLFGKVYKKRKQDIIFVSVPDINGYIKGKTRLELFIDTILDMSLNKINQNRYRTTQNTIFLKSVWHLITMNQLLIFGIVYDAMPNLIVVCTFEIESHLAENKKIRKKRNTTSYLAGIYDF